MKMILQHDRRDCGAACLAMVARHFGRKLTISKCRELTKTDRSGTNFYGIADGAGQLGLKVDALQGEQQELLDDIQGGKVTFPFIAHTISDGAMLHFVVVYGSQNGKFKIADPGKGKLTLSATNFFEIWTGKLLTFEKTNEFQTGNETKGSFSKFFSLLKGQYGRLTGVLVLSLVIAAIGISGAFVFRVVIDEFAMGEGRYLAEESRLGHDHEADQGCNETEEILSRTATAGLPIIFVTLIGLYLLQAVIQVLRGYLLSVVSKKIDIKLSLTYYNHIIDLPVSSVGTMQTGEYLSRFSDTATIRQAVSGAALTLMMDTIMVVGCGSILFLENRKLFAVTLLIILLYAVIVLCYRKPVERNNRIVMENHGKLQAYFKEAVDGIETVKAACADGQTKSKLTDRFCIFIHAVFRAGMISMSQSTLVDTVELIGTTVILWSGFGMVLAKQMSIGSSLTFYALTAYFMEPIKNIIELQPTVQTALVAADRLNDVLDLEPEEGQAKKRLPTVKKWELSHVDFRYGNRELTLQDVSLSFGRGERIAIVGESGSGKTTIAKLLLRFFEPECGSVLADGIDLRDVDLVSLRKNVAYVDQNTFLFSDTIINNLRLGKENATEGEIVDACKKSGADEFIRKLPLGYDHPLDENGMDISGGQRQRLTIARALLKQPQLLILDEATSNLDTVTESAIKTSLLQTNDDMACIIIAHRLATVRECDRIYVMNDGSIAEVGTHEELLKKEGRYAQLWRQQ